VKPPRWYWAAAWLLATLAGRCKAQVVAEYSGETVQYRAWWREVADCSGLPLKRYPKVHWVGVGGSGYFSVQGEVAMGYTHPSGDTVYVLRDAVASARIVKHEMLHVLLLKAGRGPGHPEEFARCGL
jgi:hypothetical protein